jgi:murein DD-endopeptidase MepM/ murein hydrolase activator NlpD
MTTYIRPTSVSDVSETFASHVQRGSVNAGVDYRTASGTRLVSVAAGTVTVADDNPAGSGGKMLHVNHDDGTGADYLHLNGISVAEGARVVQGQLLGYTGNTGDTTGPHLHMSFRPNHSQGFSNNGNQDFEAIVASQTSTSGGGSTPITEGDEDMGKFVQKKDGTIGYWDAGGCLTTLVNMDEVRAIEATGSAKLEDAVKLTDNLIWDKLAAVTARHK